MLVDDDEYSADVVSGASVVVVFFGYFFLPFLLFLPFLPFFFLGFAVVVLSSSEAAVVVSACETIVLMYSYKINNLLEYPF